MAVVPIRIRNGVRDIVDRYPETLLTMVSDMVPAVIKDAFDEKVRHCFQSLNDELQIVMGEEEEGAGEVVIIVVHGSDGHIGWIKVTAISGKKGAREQRLSRLGGEFPNATVEYIYGCDFAQRLQAEAGVHIMLERAAIPCKGTKWYQTSIAFARRLIEIQKAKEGRLFLRKAAFQDQGSTIINGTNANFERNLWEHSHQNSDSTTTFRRWGNLKTADSYQLACRLHIDEQRSAVKVAEMMGLLDEQGRPRSGIIDGAFKNRALNEELLGRKIEVKHSGPMDFYEFWKIGAAIFGDAVWRKEIAIRFGTKEPARHPPAETLTQSQMDQLRKEYHILMKLRATS